MTKESTKFNRLKNGDFVEVSFGSNHALIGIVVRESTRWNGSRFRSISPEVRQSIIDNPEPQAIVVRFGEYESETVFVEECRVLTPKEVFKAKLSKDWDHLIRYDKKYTNYYS